MADYTIDNNPFYNAVSKEVSDELDERARKYSARARGKDANHDIHEWLYGKTAYVTIEYDGNVVLEPPTGGFKTVYDSTNYYPKPVVNSVRISNEGDYGSLLKAEINFTVFTLKQLNEFSKTLLFVGSNSKLDPKPVIIKYGWTRGGDGKKDDQFFGFVTNFNWTLRPDGGFDCVSQLVGEGYFSLNTRADATITKHIYNNPNLAKFGAAVTTADETKPTQTTSGEVTVSPLNWIEQIKTIKKTSSTFGSITVSGTKISANPGEYGILILDLELSKQNDTKDAAAPPVKQEIRYVTLGFICNAITSTLQANSIVFKDHAYICNKDVTLGWKYPELVSSDPKNILFPGFSKYGDTNILPDEKIKMGDVGNNAVNLSNILVSVDFLFELLTAMQNENTARMNFKTTDVSISAFLKKIFEKINKCSGGLYALTISNPTSKDTIKSDLNKWLVLDTQYIPEAKGSVPKIIPVIVSESGNGNYNSIVRNVAMTSKLPAEMATAQFVSAASTLTNKTPTFIGLEANVSLPEPTKKPEDVRETLKNNAKAALTKGFAPDSIRSLETSLNDFRVFATPPTGKNSWKQGFPIPIELTITLDGIKGFRFGNAISINYLPAGYDKVVFTITKIEHNISNNDWTTTLTTVCRAKI